MLIWTFEWTALSLNDVKHYLKVVEIVYGEKMMAACLLDLFRTGWKGPHWKSWETVWCCFQWSFVDNVRNLSMLSLPFPSSKSFNDFSFAVVCVFGSGHLNNRLPLNICCPQFLYHRLPVTVITKPPARCFQRRILDDILHHLLDHAVDAKPLLPVPNLGLSITGR